MTAPPDTPESLAALLAGETYLSYAYSYPHKTAYRALNPAVPLREAWQAEDRSALFLYIHIPFCEHRCGFCNLFTQAQPKAGVAERYVAALERQAAVVADALAPARFARLAIGGGTPTFLGADLLDRVFGVAERLGALGVPASVEVSPATLDDAQADVLARRGVTRVSMGVQSFVEAETSAVARPQSRAEVAAAMGRLAGFPTRNLDLIYGIPGQTADTLRASIDAALALDPNEIYLYPLYVRPLTGLGRRETWEDQRLALYRAGRSHLLSAGWAQVTMRMFRAPGAPDLGGPVYRCQEDGMVGLGAGARSYTRALHYASPFAVSQSAVRGRIEAWIASSDADFSVASHGARLDGGEQRRRYLILSLLEGSLARAAWAQRFGTELDDDFPELAEAVAVGLVADDGAALALTPLGIERADVLGHWLQSTAVRSARRDWVLT